MTQAYADRMERIAAALERIADALEGEVSVQLPQLNKCLSRNSDNPDIRALRVFDVGRE